MIKDYRPTGVKANRTTRRVSIVWSDGHSTGMYTWELLRALGPA